MGTPLEQKSPVSERKDRDNLSTNAAVIAFYLFVMPPEGIGIQKSLGRRKDEGRRI